MELAGVPASAIHQRWHIAIIVPSCVMIQVSSLKGSKSIKSVGLFRLIVGVGYVC